MKKTYSRFHRFIAPIPMLMQMTLMLLMASKGRPAMPPTVPDTVLHAIAYFVLALLAWVAWIGLTPHFTIKKNLVLASITSVLFALIDEGIQYFSATRAAELSDVMADITGVALILAFGYTVTTLTNRRKPHE